MAITKLTDHVAVKTFATVLEERIITNSKIRQSGLVTTDPRITAKAQTPGFEGVLPFWKRPVAGEATTMSDNEANKLTPAKVTQGSMTARMIQRALGFCAMDIADYTDGADALEYAYGEFARLWVGDEESTLISVVKGVLADNVANDSGDMLKNVSIGTGTILAANKMSIANIIEARKQLGDQGGQLKNLVAHSDVINNLRAAEPNAFVPASQTKLGLETYAGLNVIETDNLGVDTTTANYPKYDAYLCGDALFGYAAGSFGEQSLAQVRDELAGYGSGQETILSRRRYIMHPLGFTNQVAPTNSVSQENSELVVAATWNRVVDRKAVPLVVVRTNG
jgi:hypothetical protein